MPSSPCSVRRRLTLWVLLVFAATPADAQQPQPVAKPDAEVKAKAEAKAAAIMEAALKPKQKSKPSPESKLGVRLGPKLATPRAAQPQPRPVARKNPWSGSARAHGSAFFGTSDQRVVGAKAAIARTDSSVELGASGEIVYGDAKLNQASRSVSKRTVLGTVSLEYRPHGMLSPFVLVTLESNLEKKIDGRYSLSVGARQTLHHTEQTEASISAAILDELTVPFEIAEPLPSTRLTRWSFRGKMRHEFDDRLRASHTTFWMPSARTAARYLVRSTSEAQYALTRIVNFTTSLNINYDSEAMARGARVNHDGQLLFGIGARW